MALVTEEAQDVAAPSGASDAAHSRPQGKPSVTTDKPGGTGTPRRVSVRIRFPHVSQPKLMVYDPRLTDGAYRLYGALFLDADWATMKGDTTLRKIADGMRCTVRAVQDWLDQLSVAGYCTHAYDREAHRTIVDLDPEQVNLGSGAIGGAGEPTFVGQVKDVSHSSMYSDIKTQTKDPAPIGATPGKVSVTETKAFLDRFGAWYLAAYKRPHSTPTKAQLFKMRETLSKAEKDKRGVSAIAGLTATEIVSQAMKVALRNKGQLWFLRNGSSLDLNTLVGNWSAIWDRFLEEGQNVGAIESGEESRRGSGISHLHPPEEIGRTG